MSIAKGHLLENGEEKYRLAVLQYQSLLTEMQIIELSNKFSIEVLKPVLKASDVLRQEVKQLVLTNLHSTPQVFSGGVRQEMNLNDYVTEAEIEKLERKAIERYREMSLHPAHSFITEDVRQQLIEDEVQRRKAEAAKAAAEGKMELPDSSDSSASSGMLQYSSIVEM